MRQLAISILSTLLTLTAYAGTIVSIGGGTPDGGPSVVGYDEVDATSWSSINSYRNVGISALLWTGVLGQTPVSYTAYLTNQIGSGTTPANVIATSDVGVSGLPTTNYFGYDAVTVNFFSGLSLGPGTYYLVIAEDSNPDTLGGWFDAGQSCSVGPGGFTCIANQYTVAPGAAIGAWYAAIGSINALFPPASGFQPENVPFGEPTLLPYNQFAVTGDLASPEPGTFTLLFAAVLGLGCTAERTRRKRSESSRS